MPPMKIRDPHHLEKVRRFYAQVGDSYYHSDYPYFINVRDLHTLCLKELFEQKKFGGPYHTVLDIGCGTGTYLRYAARFCQKGIGVDVSPESIEQARLAVKEEGLDHLDFLCMDIVQNNLPDASIDCVYSYGDVLGHIPDYERAIRELARLCRPGAVVSLEFDNKWYLKLLWDRAERREALKNLKEGHLRTWLYKGQGLDLNTFTHREIAGLLRRYHFKVIRTYGFDFFTYLIPEDYHFSTERGFMERFALSLGKLDIALRGFWPINRFGYSKILFARKE
jgi:ubiquinone/menaquinone biosynthesis C-methylase UbiE